MTQRTGATLVEVLISIFIMGIGLMALLTLFPIGILTMRQAILDDRSSHAAANGAAIAEAMNFRQDPDLLNAYLANGVIYSYFKNPNKQNIAPWWVNGDPELWDADQPYPQNPPPGWGSITGVDQPSYAVYVDPLGFRSYTSTFTNWVAGQQTSICRCNPKIINDARNQALLQNKPILWTQAISRWFTSPDDVIFGLEGKAAPIATNAQLFERAAVYSYALLLRRPKVGAPAVVDMTVVVYRGRPITVNTVGQLGEIFQKATFYANQKSIVTIDWTGTAQPPNVSIGSWILDSSPVLVDGNPRRYGPSHARFYRVVGIVQTSATTADLEVQLPFQDFPLPTPQNPPQAWSAYQGTITVLDGVVEVFPVGPGWRP
jgi:hypothetical protein